MDRDLFGTDGVRGIAGEYPLDEAGSLAIGKALGTYFTEPGGTVFLGWDPRESSQKIVDKLSEGIIAVGANVIKVGVLPTPAISFLVRENPEIDAGIMVTASHNPVEYNGVKAFDKNGDKLSDETEGAINRLILNGCADRSPEGKISEENLNQKYIEFLTKNCKHDIGNLKIGLDAANGAASFVAKDVFKSLNTAVISTHDQPDGNNINLACGATDTRSLQKLVKDQNLDIGVALDGDADRLVMVDDLGREVKGDYIMYILAKYKGYKGVVATVMSNLGFEKTLNKNGIKVERCKVGDRYVLEALAHTGYKLGGEQSGHIILYEILRTGDALLAAVNTIAAVVSSGKKLSELCDEVEIYPQAIVNIQLINKSLLDTEVVKKFIATKEEDFNDKGRLLIRASGTEPLARIMVEADDAETKCEQIAQELNQILKEQT